MFYPIKFKEIYKRKIWGGDGLQNYLQKKAPSQTGESWEIADIDRTSSVAENGIFKGKSLGYLIKKFPREILGDEIWVKYQQFPLVVKYLWAREKISLQVHPGDEFAQKYERKQGKMEAWYIVRTSDQSRIIRGVLPGTTDQELRRSLSTGELNSNILNFMKVKQGDTIFIPPGTVHSAYGDILLFEVQQASDITYRLSDWGRLDFSKKPRQLHIDRAIGVIDFQSMGVSRVKPQRLSGFPYKRKLLIKCEKFTMESIELNPGTYKENNDPSRFKVFSVVEGKGVFLFGPDKRKRQDYGLGNTFLIPAGMGNFEIKALKKSCILVCYI